MHGLVFDRLSPTNFLYPANSFLFSCYNYSHFVWKKNIRRLHPLYLHPLISFFFIFSLVFFPERYLLSFFLIQYTLLALFFFLLYFSLSIPIFKVKNRQYGVFVNTYNFKFLKCYIRIRFLIHY